MNFITSPRAHLPPEELLGGLMRDVDLRLNRLEAHYVGPYNPVASVMAVATTDDLPPDHTAGQTIYVVADDEVYTSEPNPAGSGPRVWQPGGTLPLPPP